MVRLLPGQGVVQWQRQKFLLIFFALLFLWSATGWEKAAYAATNQVPVANAGAAQTVNENTKVTLDGSASKDSDGTIAQYAWKQTAGPTVTLTGATTAKPTFTAPIITADTALTFELTVTDNSKATAKSSVIITVKNINVAPVANAGAAQSVNENTKVTLDGSASKDSDGTITQYAWKQTAGPTVTLTGATIAKPTFTAPIITADTALTFELTVTDNSKATAKSSVIITVKNVNVAPVANAGAAQTVNENTKVTLDGSASKDSDGTIAQYAWKQIAGPTVTLTGATTAKPTFTAPIITADTALTFELTVTDNSKATAKSSVIITVKNVNVAPVANAGAAQTVNENTKVTLDGSASKDSDGTIAQYAWKQTAGPTVTLTGATTAKPTFTAPIITADTALTFELTVTDNSKATAKSSVIITVKNVNVAPVANAGAAQTVNENTKVTLDGSASKDSDGTITQYAWKQTAGPTVTLTGATTAKPTFTAPIITADTALTFELTVTDNSKATAKSSVIITVKNVNVAPVASGQTQNGVEDTGINLTLVATDADGDKLTYKVVSQPLHGNVTLNGATVVYKPVLNYNGTDSFTFIANDGKLDSRAATINLTITPVNDVPVANAVAATVYDDPTSPITLAGTDADGDNLTYLKVTTPAHGSVSISGATATYTPTANYSGVDSFTYKVNDGKADSSTAKVSITVSHCPLPTPKDNQGLSLVGLSCKDKARLSYFRTIIAPYFDQQINAEQNQLQLVEEGFNDETVQHAIDTSPVLSALQTIDSIVESVDAIREGKIFTAVAKYSVGIMKGSQTLINAQLLSDPGNITKQEEAERSRESFALAEKLMDILNAEKCPHSVVSASCVNAITEALAAANKKGFFEGRLNLDKDKIQKNLEFYASISDAYAKGEAIINLPKNISKAKFDRAVSGFAASLSKMVSDAIVVGYASQGEEPPKTGVAGIVLGLIDNVITPNLKVLESCVGVDKFSSPSTYWKCVSSSLQEGSKLFIKGAINGIGAVQTIRHTGTMLENRTAKMTLEELLMAGEAHQDAVFKKYGVASNQPLYVLINAIGEKYDSNVQGVENYGAFLDVAWKLGKGQLTYSLSDAEWLVRQNYTRVVDQASVDFNSPVISLSLSNRQPGDATITANIDLSQSGFVNGTLGCTTVEPKDIQLPSDPWTGVVSKTSTSFSIPLKFTKGGKGSIMCNLYRASGIYAGSKTIAITGKGYDEDGDGMPYTWETRYGLNPDDKTDASLDKDGDQLSNFDEFKAGTKPDVKDSDNDGFSDWEEYEAGTSPLLPTDKPLSAPTNLKAVAGDSKVMLSWDAVPGADHYFVCGFAYGSMKSLPEHYGCLVGELFIYGDPKTATSFTVNGLENGTEYHFQVVVYNAAGKQSPASNEVAATPQASSITAPQNLKATPSDGKLTVSWDAVTGAVGYGICRATVSIPDVGKCASYAGGAWTGTTNTQTELSGLVNGTKYYFRVIALDAKGNKSPASAEATATPKKPSGATGKLNDTGITTCGNDTQNNQPCPLLDYPGQDGDSGRDVTANDDSDGHAGFSFTKISNTGQSLPASATQWSCVKDNVTGLMWEIKQGTPNGIYGDTGLHDPDDVFTWYEPDNTKNGGHAGDPAGDVNSLNVNYKKTCYGHNHKLTGTWCNSKAYVERVNTAGWCGAKDWRMPKYRELRSIVSHNNNPAIDTAWFPNTVGSWFWSSSPVAGNGGNAWSVAFDSGYGYVWGYKYGSSSVRLVRSGQ